MDPDISTHQVPSARSNLCWGHRLELYFFLVSFSRTPCLTHLDLFMALLSDCSQREMWQKCNLLIDKSLSIPLKIWSIFALFVLVLNYFLAVWPQNSILLHIYLNRDWLFQLLCVKYIVYHQCKDKKKKKSLPAPQLIFLSKLLTLNLAGSHKYQMLSAQCFLDELASCDYHLKKEWQTVTPLQAGSGNHRLSHIYAWSLGRAFQAASTKLSSRGLTGAYKSADFDSCLLNTSCLLF